MANDNPLREDVQEPTQTEPEAFINLSQKKTVGIGSMDGDYMEFDTGGSTSRFKEDGTYEDQERTNYALDPDGTIFDKESFRGLSLTKRFIQAGDQDAYCQSIFHPLRMPTRIKIGHDGGRGLLSKFACYHCYWRELVLVLGGALVGLTILFGIYKGIFF